MKNWNWTSYLFGIVGGIALTFAVVGTIGDAVDNARARDCDAMGRTMLDDHAYLCVRMSEEAKP